MFERFTDRARQVLVLANEEGKLLGHTYLGSEHILLGLLREDEGIAAGALRAVGVHLDAARVTIDEIVGTTGRGSSSSSSCTPRATKVLELALRETVDRADRFIDTEHLLLGIVRDGGGVAVATITRLGTDPLLVRHQINRLRAGLVVGGDPVDQPVTARAAESSAPGPRCPRCRALLEDELAYRVLTASPAEPETGAGPLAATIVYCRRCGITIAPASAGWGTVIVPALSDPFGAKVGSSPGGISRAETPPAGSPEGPDTRYRGGQVPDLAFPADLWRTQPPAGSPLATRVDLRHPGRFDPDGTLVGRVAGSTVRLVLRLPWPTGTVTGFLDESPVTLTWKVKHGARDERGLPVTAHGAVGAAKVDLKGVFRRGRGNSFGDGVVSGTLADADLMASIEPVSSPLGQPSAVVATGSLGARPFEIYLATGGRDGRVRGIYNWEAVALDVATDSSSDFRVSGCCPAPPEFTVLLVACLAFA